MKGLLATAAKNTVFANLILVFVLVGGVLSTLFMVREMFPVFSLDLVSISVAYPGAGPEEVEEGISRKIEEALEGVVGIEEYYTTAAEGIGTAMVEIDEDYGDKAAVKADIRDRIEAINTFPVDAEKPVIAERFFTRDVINICLWGDADERVLKELAEDIKDEIRALPEVSRVSVTGVRPYEISIEVSEERLREFGLSLVQVSEAIRRGSLNMPSGTIRTRQGEIKVRTVGRRYTAEDFADLVVVAARNGSVITLSQIADIRDDFEETAQIGTFNGKRAALLTVRANEGEDAIRIAKAVREFVKKRKAKLPTGLELTPWRDSSRMIQDRIDVLTKNGLIGFLLVFLLLWLFLDLRLAFWVGLGIPVSLGGGIMVLAFVGGSINMLSLFAMIMVVGIIVDDALVVGESIYVHRRQGKSRLQAAVDGVKEVWWPVTGGVTTTIIAFTPLFFVTGMMGKFFAVIPVVVMASLAASLVESLFILPAHLSHLPDPGRRPPWIFRGIEAGRLIFSRGLEAFVSRGYTRIIAFTLRWRYAVVATGIGLVFLSIGLITGGFTKFVTFPKIDGDFIKSQIEFSDGTPARVVRGAVMRMSDTFMKLENEFETATGEKLIQCVWATVGEQSGMMAKKADYVGEVAVDLLPSERRGIHSETIKQTWLEHLGPMPDARRMAFEDPMGGPAGKPIEIRLLGHDIDKLDAAADDLKAKLDTYDGVYAIADDREPGKKELRVRLRPLARTLGLTLRDLAEQVRAKWFGDEALRIQRGRDDVRIKIRYPQRDRNSFRALDEARIRVPGGGEVPLAEVAETILEPGYAQITRQSGFRRVVVTAEIDESSDANAREIVAELQYGSAHQAASGEPPFLSALQERHPGVVYKLEGQERDRRDSVSSLFRGFVLVVIAIFVILATVFKSYVQPFLIILLIPMGCVGVVIGHWITGLTLTLLSLLGVVALAGVVVNDAIVFIDYFNQRIRAGVPVMEALLETGQRRFRAMFLTTFTTCVGLLPLMLESSFQAQILIPMANAIVFGLAAASASTLFGLPSLLLILNDLRRVNGWLWSGDWRTPEAAEFKHLRVGETA